ADSRRDSFTGLDALCEGRAKSRGIFFAHGAQPQMIRAIFRESQANKAASKARHKIDGFRRDELRRQGQVAFVLAIFIVDYDNHPTRTNLFERDWNIDKWSGRGHCTYCTQTACCECFSAKEMPPRN